MKYRVRRHEVVQPLDTSYRLIPLTQGQNAIVDADDFEWLSQFSWHARWSESTKSFYALTSISRKTILMHRMILDCSQAEEVDHRDHKTLDNRRGNIWKCTRSQNLKNRRPFAPSGIKGVYRHRKKWMAQIVVDGKTIYLGYHPSKEKARAIITTYHGTT